MKRYLLVFSLIFFVSFISCENDDFNQDKKDYLRSLGVDVSKIVINEEANVKDPIIFKTKESAMKFFQLMSPKGITYYGNVSISKKYNEGFDIYAFLESQDFIIYTRGIGQDGSDEDNQGGCPPWVMCSSDDNRSTGGCDRGLAKLEDWHYVAGYTVSFVYNKDSSGNYSVSGMTSGLSGAHVGTSWTHENSITTTVNGKIEFKVNGKQHYNIIVEGIGTVYTQDVEISGEYDPCSGEYKIKAK